MNLEDGITDVIEKALRGLEMTPADVASAAGISVEAYRSTLSGRADDAVLRQLAEVLGLDADALVNLPGYCPEQGGISGIRRIELPFREWTVNAWLLKSGETTLLFDTGWGRGDILQEIENAALDGVFITHGHADHIGGVEALKAAGVKIVSEIEAFCTGEFSFGDIGIKTVDLSGHCEPAVGYFVSGFEKQLLVVGDAIFAGSVGGCRDQRQFSLALGNLGKVLRASDENCLILPGHGPMSSVAEEMKANPFRKYFLGAKNVR